MGRKMSIYRLGDDTPTLAKGAWVAPNAAVRPTHLKILLSHDLESAWQITEQDNGEQGRHNQIFLSLRRSIQTVSENSKSTVRRQSNVSFIQPETRNPRVVAYSSLTGLTSVSSKFFGSRRSFISSPLWTL